MDSEIIFYRMVTTILFIAFVFAMAHAPQTVRVEDCLILTGKEPNGDK